MLLSRPTIVILCMYLPVMIQAFPAFGVSLNSPKNSPGIDSILVDRFVSQGEVRHTGFEGDNPPSRRDTDFTAVGILTRGLWCPPPGGGPCIHTNDEE